MDLINLLSGVAPNIVAGLLGPEAGKVTQVLSNALLGKPNAPMDELMAAVQSATPEQLAALEMAAIQDKADARAMQKAAIASGDKFVAHFIYWFAWFWSLASVAYFFFVTFGGVTETGQHFADVILGFLLGTIVATMIGFFYGSADKDGKK
jgi:amino acid transporter